MITELTIKQLDIAFQAHGPHLGQRHMALSLSGSNTGDLPAHLSKQPDQVLDIDSILNQIKVLSKKKPQGLSLTGGEPLLQVDALAQLLPAITVPVTLFSNGTLPDRIGDLIQFLAHICLTYTPGFQDDFLMSMAACMAHPSTAICYQVPATFNLEDLIWLAKSMAEINPSFPLIIQPATPFSGRPYKSKVPDIHKAYQVVSPYVNTIWVRPDISHLLHDLWG